MSHISCSHLSSCFHIHHSNSISTPFGRTAHSAFGPFHFIPLILSLSCLLLLLPEELVVPAVEAVLSLADGRLVLALRPMRKPLQGVRRRRRYYQFAPCRLQCRERERERERETQALGGKRETERCCPAWRDTNYGLSGRGRDRERKERRAMYRGGGGGSHSGSNDVLKIMLGGTRFIWGKMKS